MTEKNRKRVAVISGNPRISDFFALEAITCGCEAERFSAPPEELAGYELAVVDAEAGYCMADGSGCLIAVVIKNEDRGRENDFPWADFLWRWPMAVDELRQVYEGLPRADSVSVEKSARGQGEKILYLLSEKERSLLYRNQKILLSESEWQILLRLGEARGEAVSRGELKEMLSASEKGNLVDVYICRLRKKLENPFGIRLIETQRSQGYRLRGVLKRMSNE